MRQSLLIFKIVLQQFRLYPGRVFITLAGIIASACAVVWVVSGYDGLVSQFDENAGKYLGKYDVLLVPQGPPGAVTYADPETIEALQGDAAVLEVNPVQQTRVTVTKVLGSNETKEVTSLGLLVDGRPPVNGAPPIEPVLVGTPADESPYELLSGSWLSGEEVVLSSGAAKSASVQVGDEVLITSMANQLKLRVAGIVQQAPEAPVLGGGRNSNNPAGGRRGGAGRGRAPSGSGRSKTQGIQGDRAEGSTEAERVVLSEKVPSEKVSSEKASSEGLGEDSGSGSSAVARMAVPTPWVQGVAINAAYVRPEIAERINGVSAKPTVVQIALRNNFDSAQFAEKWEDRLAASEPPLKIVDFSTVRAGLEASRSVSSQRAQAYAASGFASLAALFIIFSLLSMGVSERAREFALLRAVAFSRAQIAAIVAVESLVLAVVGWIGGLLAGFLLVGLGSYWMPGLFSVGASLGWTCVWLTGVTVLAGALGAAVLPAWRATRITPIEVLASSPVKSLKRRTLSWMAILGLALTNTAPLTVFVLPLPVDWRIWCYSMVTYPALVLGMVLVAPTLIVWTERALGGVAGKLLRLDGRLLRTQLAKNLWRTIGATLALAVGLGMFASTQTWGYSMLQPFLPGKWLPDVLVAFQPNGLSEDAIAAIKDSDGVVDDEVMPLAIEQAKFDWGDAGAPAQINYDNAVLFGIDPAQAITAEDPLLDMDFVVGNPKEVAQELSKGDCCLISQDFSRTSGKKIGDSITLVLPSDEDARVSYRVVGVVDLPGWQWITKFSGVRRHFVRTSTMMFADREAVLKDFRLARPEFCWFNLESTARIDKIENQMQEIAENYSVGNKFDADGLGEVASYRPFARVTATDTVTRSITIRAKDMIWGMSLLPLITLFIMSLAVVNAVIASVRARQWEFGVLRSIGTTRWQLVRLVVAETLLIGIAASVLSLIFGLVAGWCGVGMATYGRWGAFVGEPVFLIPWQQLGFGFAVTLGLCALAAIWPAIRIGRAEPLQLLAAGRSAR